MEKLWSHIFNNELKVKPEAHNVFLTEALNSSNLEREKVAEILFEKFSIFNIHIEPQPVMTLYSTTKTSGLIVESSESMTQIVPIYEGYIIPQGIRSNPIGGEIITKHFYNLIKDKLNRYNVNNKLDLSKRIKEKFIELELENSKIIPPLLEFTLPDGNKINIGEERFTIPEAIFDPSLIDFDCQPIHKLIYDSVKSCDIN
jgi:actin